jgi:hypothetical protein
MGPEREVSEGIRATALGLRIDTVTAEVVGRLREAGVAPILLKGPALAAWLYADGTPRGYGDSDLLVQADDRATAVSVLRQAGFKPGQPGWQEVSWSWRRAQDGAWVDLHTGLFSASAPPERAWATLVARTTEMRVGGTEVRVLSPPALAFHVALHAAQHGAEGGRPMEDLERALRVADEDCWREAATIAAALEATGAFAAGLALRPEGAAVAARLGVTDTPPPAAVRFHAEGAAPLVRGIEHLAAAPGWGARARFLARKLLPKPAELRKRSSLARRGGAGLALAYLLQPLWMAVRLPGALLAWWAARRRDPAQG